LGLEVTPLKRKGEGLSVISKRIVDKPLGNKTADACPPHSHPAEVDTVTGLVCLRAC
jgi:hypothetical protein